MIKVGDRVKVRIAHLYYANQNVRIDDSVSTVSGTSVPQGAAGDIMDVQGDEVKVHLYWNPSNIAGNGNDVVIRVKKVIFGNSFDYI